MSNTIRHIAYRRVSTIQVRNGKAQSTERQMHNLGIDFDLEFEDHITGTKFEARKQLQECLNTLQKGDHLHIHSIDRLARNTKDLLSIVEDLIARKVVVHFHKEGLVFGGDNDPMQAAIGQVLLSVIGAIHTFQATMIQESVKEGMRVAKAKGVKVGGANPKWKETYEKNKDSHKTTKDSQEAKRRRTPIVNIIKDMLEYSNNALTLSQIADKLNSKGITTVRGKPFSEATVSRIVRKDNIPYKRKHKYDNVVTA